MVYELCMYVLSRSFQNPPIHTPNALIKSCLRTLQAYLSWIPLPYIFDTELINALLTHFIVPISSRIEAIKCFTEIASLTFSEVDDPNVKNGYLEKLCYYYCLFIKSIADLTKDRDLTMEYESVKDTKQRAGFENFARQTALAISAVLKHNLTLIEQTTNTMD